MLSPPLGAGHHGIECCHHLEDADHHLFECCPTLRCCSSFMGIKLLVSDMIFTFWHEFFFLFSSKYFVQITSELLISIWIVL